MKILIFCDWFAPAFKAGGPVRSIVNLVEFLKRDHQIHVFTSDRDLDDQTAFPDILVDQWILRDGYSIYHYSPGKMTFGKVKEVIKEINPDRIYLNSMFSNMIIPLLVAGSSGKIILAPRGMLKDSALAVKPIRKYLYLHFLKLLNLEQKIRFHSSGPIETRDIQKIFPRAPKITEAPNLPVSVSSTLMPAIKRTGDLNLIFIGRMQSIKNLHFLLELLKGYSDRVRLDIVATSEDQYYAEQCNSLIVDLKDTHDIHIHIDLPHHQIRPFLEQAHVFVLPTLGESFGHAIFEALAVGCPVLISNQTPWIHLEVKKAGFELPLEKQTFLEKIKEFQAMDDQQWQLYRAGALELARDYVSNADFKSKYEMLFS